MKKINSMLRRCKTLSSQSGRTCFRSRSTRDHYQKFWNADEGVQDCKEPCEIIFVGSSRRRYVISSKYLNHPLLNALIERSRGKPGLDGDPDLYVKCEVVLFDHLLWMLENGDPDLSSDSLEELAELYVY